MITLHIVEGLIYLAIAARAIYSLDRFDRRLLDLEIQLSAIAYFKRVIPGGLTRRRIFPKQKQEQREARRRTL